MEITKRHAEILVASAQLIWAKGVHNPNESAVANALTQFAEAALKTVGQEPAKKGEGE